MAATTTSAEGIAYIESIEGVVLKAYRDPVGIWTIGGGLTAASGVIDPKPGMVISQEEASRLMAKALKLKYEPAVVAAMPGAKQHEFDGGVSFHWNTGAIRKASWVTSWNARDWDEVERRLLLWNKGGGRVLPGLVRRRKEEFAIIRFGSYPGNIVRQPAVPTDARWALPVTRDEIAEIREAFSKLGYDQQVSADGVPATVVRQFQADHDLTVDGIIGRATLSTLQRRLDAKRKSTGTAAGGTVAGAAAEASQEAAGLPDWLIWVALTVIALLFIRLAWSYRDVIAAKVQRVLPGVTRFLRRF